MKAKKFLFIITSLVLAGFVIILTGELLLTSTSSNREESYQKPRKRNKFISAPVAKKVRKKSHNLIPLVGENGERLTNSFAEVKKCYPQIDQRSDYLLEDVFEQLSTNREYKDVLDFKNFHYDLPGGEKRRLQIRLDEDTNGSTYHTLKLFAVDKEGFPDPLKVDPRLERNPSPETIRSFLEQGSVQFTQDIGNRYFDKDNYISFVKENDQVQSFEAYVKGHVLKCSSDINEVAHCRCAF